MKKVISLLLAISALSVLIILTMSPVSGHGGGHSSGSRSGSRSSASHVSHGNRGQSRVGAHGHGTRRSSHSWANRNGRGWRNRHGFGWRNNRFNVGYWNGGWGLWWGGAWLPWGDWCTTYGYGWGWNDCLDYPNGGIVPGNIIQRVQQEVPFDDGY